MSIGQRISLALTLTLLLASAPLVWAWAGGVTHWGLVMLIGGMWIAVVLTFHVIGARWIAWTVTAPLRTLAQDLERAATAVRVDAAARLRSVSVGNNEPEEVARVRNAVAAFADQWTRSDRSRATTVTSIAHDMKTPLRGTALALRRLYASESLNVEDQSLLEEVIHEVDSTSDLASQLVEWGRFESPDVSLKLELAELGEIVEVAARSLRQQADRRGVVIECAGSSTAMVDVPGATRAVRNLVANAVKHARERVDVSVFHGLVRVKDDGPGLAALALQGRGWLESVVREGGEEVPTGLGLQVVRRIMEAHEGRLVVERSDGTGTVMLLYFGEMESGVPTRQLL